MCYGNIMIEIKSRKPFNNFRSHGLALFKDPKHWILQKIDERLVETVVSELQVAGAADTVFGNGDV